MCVEDPLEHCCTHPQAGLVAYGHGERNDHALGREQGPDADQRQRQLVRGGRAHAILDRGAHVGDGVAHRHH